MLQSEQPKIHCTVLGWTGVILNDYGVIKRANLSALHKLGRQVLSDDYDSKRMPLIDWKIFYTECGINPSQFGKVSKVFAQEYRRLSNSLTPFPNITATLTELKNKGGMLVLFSSIPRDALIYLAKKLGLAKFFNEIISSECDTKSGAGLLRQLIRERRFSPIKSLIVDASEINIKMGLEVGMITVCVESDHAGSLRAADFRIQTLDNLPSLIDETLFVKKEIDRSTTIATQEYRQFIETRYLQKLTGKLPRIPFFYHADNRSFAEEILSLGIVPPYARIADIGSGTSISSQLVARQCHGIVFNVDISYLALSQSSREQPDREANPSCIFINSDAARLPFGNALFDLVICSEMLEHVFDDRTALAEMRRILKPEGFLIISVPNAIEHTLPPFRNLLQKFNEAGHVREYDFLEMKQLLTDCQLPPLRTWSTCFFFFWVLNSLERSVFSDWIEKFFKEKYKLATALEMILATLIFKENQIARTWARFGHRSHFLSRVGHHEQPSYSSNKVF